MLIDKRTNVLLLMLDLSAAFDTIDHDILLHRLSCKYGITWTAHKWFESYLKDRTQSVLINDVESRKKQLDFGVPQ